MQHSTAYHIQEHPLQILMCIVLFLEAEL